jgi:hypothetical protein
MILELVLPLSLKQVPRVGPGLDLLVSEVLEIIEKKSENR